MSIFGNRKLKKALDKLNTELSLGTSGEINKAFDDVEKEINTIYKNDATKKDKLVKSLHKFKESLNTDQEQEMCKNIIRLIDCDKKHRVGTQHEFKSFFEKRLKFIGKKEDNKGNTGKSSGGNLKPDVFAPTDKVDNSVTSAKAQQERYDKIKSIDDQFYKDLAKLDEKFKKDNENWYNKQIEENDKFYKKMNDSLNAFHEKMKRDEEKGKRERECLEIDKKKWRKSGNISLLRTNLLILQSTICYIRNDESKLQSCLNHVIKTWASIYEDVPKEEAKNDGEVFWGILMGFVLIPKRKRKDGYEALLQGIRGHKFHEEEVKKILVEFAQNMITANNNGGDWDWSKLKKLTLIAPDGESETLDLEDFWKQMEDLTD